MPYMECLGHISDLYRVSARVPMGGLSIDVAWGSSTGRLLSPERSGERLAPRLLTADVGWWFQEHGTSPKTGRDLPDKAHPGPKGG